MKSDLSEISADILREEMDFDMVALNELQLGLYIFQEAVSVWFRFQQLLRTIYFY